MKRTTFAALLAMGALALPPAAATAGSGYEQQGMQGAQGRQLRGAQAQQAAQQASRLYTVRGNLVDLRTARIRQDQAPHLLARVRLDTGRTAVVDLGRTQQIQSQNVRFQRGQVFEAQGVSGRINQRPVLVAQRFQAQGQPVFQVSRLETRAGQQQALRQQQGQQQWWSQPQQPRRQASERRPMQQPRQQATQRRPMQEQRQQATQRRSMQQQPVAQAHRTIRGEVVETRELKLQGIQERHNFAKIRTQSGEVEVVDLGPSRALEGLILEKGERTVVRGTSARINGRPVLVARQVAQVASLDRADFLGEESGTDQPQQQGQGGS